VKRREKKSDYSFFFQLEENEQNKPEKERENEYYFSDEKR